MPVIRKLLDRQPRRDRRRGSSAPPASWTSPPSRCSPTPTRTRRSSAAADEAVPLPGDAPADTYLRGPADHRRGAAHRRRRGAPRLRLPLRERRIRHAACAQAGLTFVGPPPEAIEAMGSKIAAKELMAARWRPGAARHHGQRRPPTDPDCRTESNAIGYPVLVKAAFGGGGRGMRVVARARRPRQRAVAAARREAAGRVRRRHRVPRALPRRAPAHRGADLRRPATATSCTCSSGSARSSAATRRSSRRRRPRRCTSTLRRELGDAAVAAGKAIGYVGAGTVEFVLATADGTVLLPRGQHPAAGGAPGHRAGHRARPGRAAAPGRRGRSRCPSEVRRATLTGHAIEARLYAEDAAAGFLPATGTVHRFDVPDLPGLRVDTGIAERLARSALHYDAMLAKVIAHGADPRPGPPPAGPGPGRDPAARRGHQPRPARRHPARAGVPRPATSTPATSTRHDPQAPGRARGGTRAAPPLHALAAALAGQAARRAAAPVLRHAPLRLAQRAGRAAAGRVRPAAGRNR